MSECHFKETERADKLQSDVKKRLNRAIGQLNGVKNMIDDNRYCGDVLTQLAAAESAVHSAAELILRDHLETCVKDRIRRGDDEVIEEAMRLIKKFARSEISRRLSEGLTLKESISMRAFAKVGEICRLSRPLM